MQLDLPNTGSKQGWYVRYLPVLVLFIAVFITCLIGIASRPVGLLASVWPANAVMLGVLLRIPGASRWTGWVAGALAYLLADLLTGSSWTIAIMLNTANLLSVLAAYLILSRASRDVIRLRHPTAMLHVVIAAVTGGLAAGLLGGFAGQVVFGGSLYSGIIFWWITEVVNYVAILPIFLSAPSWQTIFRSIREHAWSARMHDLLPVVMVVLACTIALLVGGYGAIAFPILPLLWCALVYPVFLTTILILVCSQFALLFVFAGHYAEYAESLDKMAIFSIRFGISMLAIAPITLSIITHNRSELLKRLHYISTHDSLTGVGNRAAFLKDAEEILNEMRHPHAVMMIDLDHFKAINDTYGHAAGDEVLRETARRIKDCLRPADRLGRMGGEEFAVFLRSCPVEAALDAAERIRQAIAATPVQISDTLFIPVTASLGVTFAEQPTQKSLDALLAEADTALYGSKKNGRNRVEVKQS